MTDEIKDNYGKMILKEEIQWLCEMHQLGRLNRFASITNGKANVNIFVETQTGRFVFRYLSFPAPTLKERLNYIENILSALKKASLPVVGVIKNKSGGNYSEINNRVVQVYPYIEACKFYFAHNQITSCANMLNKFHTILSSHKQGPLPSYSVHPSRENLQIKLNQLYEKKDFIMKSSLARIEALFAAIREDWERVDKSSLVETIIHDDWHPNNLLYQSDGSVACILDFDGIQRGKRIYDVAYGVYTIYNRSYIKRGNKFTKMFLNAYGQLTPEEERILSLVVASVGLYFIMQFASTAEIRLKRQERFIKFLLSKKGSQFFW